MTQNFCYGCRVKHLSQIKHSCIQLLPEQKLELYFDDALRPQEQEVDDQELIDMLASNFED